MVEANSHGRVARLDGMATTLQDPRVAEALERMYSESREQMSQLRAIRPDMSTARTAQERADTMSNFYIPVTPEAGRLLYSLVRATRPNDHRGIRYVIWYFGAAPGIGGARQRQRPVVTTELSESKIAAAKKTFAETGLDDVITVLGGDALCHPGEPGRTD